MRKYFLGLMVPVGLLVTWEISARLGIVNPLFFPGPTQIFLGALERIKDGSLLLNLLITLARLIAGFAIGATFGYLAGVIMGINRNLAEMFEPFLSVVYTIPKIVLLPIFLLIFGLGEAPKIALISLTVFFYVWINTLGAVKNIPSEYMAICKSITSRKMAVITDVIIPASTPAVFTGLRVGISVATLITISTEFVMSDSGLGHLIYNSRYLMRYEDAFVGIFTVGLMGYFLQTTIKTLGAKLTPWQAKPEKTTTIVRG